MKTGFDWWLLNCSLKQRVMGLYKSATCVALPQDFYLGIPTSGSQRLSLFVAEKVQKIYLITICCCCWSRNNKNLNLKNFLLLYNNQLWSFSVKTLNKALSVPFTPRVPRLSWGLGRIWGLHLGNWLAKRFSGVGTAEWGDSRQLQETQRILRSSPLDLFRCQTALRASVASPLRASTLSCCRQAGGTKCHNLEEIRWRTSATAVNRNWIHLASLKILQYFL